MNFLSIQSIDLTSSSAITKKCTGAHSKKLVSPTNISSLRVTPADFEYLTFKIYEILNIQTKLMGARLRKWS